MKKMINVICNGTVLLAIVMSMSGCGACPQPKYPQPIVFDNGVTYKPTWDGYRTCESFNDRPNAECRKSEDGPIVKILEPDIKATLNSFLADGSDITTICNKIDHLKLFPDYESPNSCKLHVFKYLNLMVNPSTLEFLGYSYASDVEKAYQIGLIDKATWLIFNGRVLEAYQDGLIDKKTARDTLLKRGESLKAYEAGLIDKETAELYMKQEAINVAKRAAQQQLQATERATKAAQESAERALREQQNQELNRELRRYQKLYY